MSEFLAEARIVVRPDTSRFREQLEAQLKSVTQRPIPIPIIPVVGPGFAAAAAGTAALATAQGQAAVATANSAAALASATTIARQYTGVVDLASVATVSLAQAQGAEAAAATKAAAAQANHTRQLNQGVRGGAASLLTLLGLRGATLAASGAFLGGTAAVVGFSKAVQSAASLETELNVFRVTAGATADEMERTAEAAKQLGRDITLPGVTAGAAATAMTELAKAGLSVEDSIAGARGALQLATAAQIDVKQSTELVANALNSFGLAGTDAVKIADLLAGAAKSAQGEIGEFGTALGQVASVADQFGVSAEDTVTLLAQLAKAGLQGGRAGTTLRVAILGLIKPTAAARVELEKLEAAGVKITKPNGAFDPTAFAQINKALQNYSKEQQNVVRNTIFSSDAIKVLGRATAGGVEDFNRMNAAVSEAGLAQETAAARTEGFAGSVENLSNQMEGLGTTLGGVVLGPLGAVADFFANIAQRSNDLATSIINLKKDVNFDEEDSRVRAFRGSWESLIKVGDRIPDFTIGFLDKTNLLVQFGNETQSAAEKLESIVRSANRARDSFDGLTKSLTGVSAAAAQFQGLNVKNIENIIVGFNAEEVRAKISKDNSKLLDVLNTEQAFLEKQLTRDYVKNRPALRRAIENALLGAKTEIDSVLAKGKADTERIKRDAKDAARDRDQALLAGQATARDKQKNLISTAEQTPGLQDDLKRQEGLRQLILRQIVAVNKQIKDEGAKAAALAALDAVLIQVKGAIKSVKERQKEIREAQREALLQGIDLDISLAQITDNQKAEVAARNKKIAELNKDLAAEAKAHGKTTVAYKTIRNEIAAQNAALKEIQAERTKGQSFAQASFDFLQAQQGFASNLLGNLIPRGATGGLVGGVQSALAPVAGVADGMAKSSPTAGQAQTTNSILGGILLELKQLNGEQKAPEARRQMSSQQSTMDTTAGGYGG